MLLCSHTETEGGAHSRRTSEQDTLTPGQECELLHTSRVQGVGACGISGPPGHGQVGQCLLGASGELVRLEIIDINKAFKNGISSPESEMLPSRE